jgi:hypothetical protein
LIAILSKSPPVPSGNRSKSAILDNRKKQY